MSNLEQEQRQGGPTIRVLIVDNNLIDRRDMVEKVEKMGFVPIIAGELEQNQQTGQTVITGGQELIKHAELKVRESRCHAALVDMRLYDDEDSGDKSGLNLAKRLEPAKCIIVTGYSSVPNHRKAQENSAVAMVGKEEGSDTIQYELEKTLVALLRQAFIVAPEGWIEQHILPNLKSEDNRDVTYDEVRDLLAILFPDSDRLTVDHLSQSVPSPTVLTSGLRRNSIVVRLDAQNFAPFIVKMAATSRIRRELTNYDAYVRDRLPGRRYAQLSRCERLWNVAGIAYAFLGEDSTNGGFSLFRTFYHAHSAQEILSSLQDFFAIVWTPLYDQSDELRGSLFAEYDRLWSREIATEGTDVKKMVGPLSSKLAVWAYKDNTRTSRILGIELPDPRRWITKHHKSSALPKTRQAIVHGDLHGDNLFVDAHKLTWVIDFERTGPGHVLADFVRLEHDILSRLANITSTKQFCDLLIAITTPRSPAAGIPPAPDGTTNADQGEVEKALQVIRGLRKIAYDLFHYTDQREYYWGLLLDTLFGIQRVEKLMDSTLKSSSERAPLEQSLERSLLLGGILCRRLSEWGEQWPPADWQHHLEQDPSPSGGNPGPQNRRVANEDYAKKQIKILFLAANPSDNVRLHLDQEYREIRDALQMAETRERFSLTPELAVRANELTRLFRKHKPMIVHFSGHGSPAGEIILQDDHGKSAPLPQKAVQDIFGILNRKNNQIQCVVLNACFTDWQAQMIAEHVDVVIGISSKISDKAAIRFAVEFYECLSADCDIQTAFDSACTAINLNRLPFPQGIRLFCRFGIDPHSYSLTQGS